MLRKIVNWLPQQTIHNKTLFTFCQQNNNEEPKDKQPKWSKPNQSNGLQRILITYIRMLKNQKQKYLPKKAKIHNLFVNFQLKKLTRRQSVKKDPKIQKSEQDIDSPTGPTKTQLNLGFFSIIIAAFLIFLNESTGDMSPISSRSSRVVNQNQLLGLLQTGKYNQDIIIGRQIIYNHMNGKPIYQTICFIKELGRAEIATTAVITNLPAFLTKIEEIPIPYRVVFSYVAETIPEKQRSNFGRILLFAGIAYLVYKWKTGAFRGITKNGLDDMMNMKKFEPIKPENIKTHFKDVAGMHQAKSQITEFVDFLKNPEKYIEMGAKIPKGALLTGPPGTGKTLLARACAGEAGVPFFYVSGSEFVQKYVGLGANRVRSLFQSAAKAAPSIIFIDQIDAIGKKRNSGPFANEQKQNTLNQLLVNMDGFDSKNKIIVMAATNLKDSLDPALLRPGRFDRAIQISLPNFQERIQILKVHLAKVKFTQKFTIEELAKKVSVLTPGFSGAELANICNQAAILAARKNKDDIQLPEFEKATERVMAGLQKRNLFSDEEKECLAYYECGRAVAAWFTQGADPVIKISIAPYSKSNKGYSHELKDEMPLKVEKQLLNKAVCYLAGRVSEQLFKGYITSNGDTDMKKAKKIITYIVTKFGMSDIGRIGYPDIEYVRKPYSEDTEMKINKEIDKIYKECISKSQKLIKQKSEMIQKLKAEILVKETLTHNSLKQILGDRPFSDHQNYQKFLKDSQQEEPVIGTPQAVAPQ